MMKGETEKYSKKFIEDFTYKWNAVCELLKSSGKDLSKIVITKSDK